jgi:hypothetical protein
MSAFDGKADVAESLCFDPGQDFAFAVMKSRVSVAVK